MDRRPKVPPSQASRDRRVEGSTDRPIDQPSPPRQLQGDPQQEGRTPQLDFPTGVLSGTLTPPPRPVHPRPHPPGRSGAPAGVPSGPARSPAPSWTKRGGRRGRFWLLSGALREWREENPLHLLVRDVRLGHRVGVAEEETPGVSGLSRPGTSRTYTPRSSRESVDTPPPPRECSFPR